MIIVTTDTVPGKEVIELKGFVKGSTIQAKHVGKDILAGLKTIIGGEIREYNEMMEQARKIVISRMVEDAKAKGANAIIACCLQTSSVMANASKIVAYGTAVKINE
ncbi:YbjQ family protein [Pseudalkalibacillus sp. A8]|uniref:YbjQ family protein n=1 Tax=Pseudalkalibacillus sp. A8 TaxID=3382641 RepID=UPI0038B5BDF5